MDLSKLELKDEYRSDEDNIVRDFYFPCLLNSTTYYRSVGYFTSASLSLAAKGLSKFIEAGGKMYLVASPFFDKEDLESIERGIANQQAFLEDLCLRQLENVQTDLDKTRLGYLEWLISNGKLEIKIAVMTESKRMRPGIYHEKIGIFEDPIKNLVAFTGSNNETAGGLLNNFESSNVFTSWDVGVAHRAVKKKDNFLKLWENKTEKLEVVDITKAAKDRLLRYRKPDPTLEDPEAIQEIPRARPRKEFSAPAMPSHIELRNYQRDAIVAWGKQSARGFFEMATGSGKTITALSATCKLYEQLKRLFVIVVVPYKHLVQQWSTEMRAFDMEPIQAMHSYDSWFADLHRAISNYELGVSSFGCVAVTNATFSSEKFQEAIAPLQTNVLLIGDEAHNLGSANLLKSLTEKFNFRIGLSATPDRGFDEDGTRALRDYFGPTCVTYTLADALRDKVLTPYRYHIVQVPFSELESDEYVSLSDQISILQTKIESASRNSGSLSDGEEKQLERLLFKRANLIACASEKLTSLATLLKTLPPIEDSLFYCGAGHPLMPEEDSDMRQIELVLKFLGTEFNLPVRKFTAGESLQERREIIDQFLEGALKGIVAIRCLDEGVDIPKIRSAFILASTSNSRQFIQRRGRLLRRHPQKTHAEIYDFLVVPDNKRMPPKYCQALLRKELQRIEEFASLATNGPAASGSLLEIKKKFRLLDT